MQAYKEELFVSSWLPRILKYQAETLAAAKQGVPPLIEMYFFMWRCFRLVVNLIDKAQGIFQGSFVGLWLGVFTREQQYAINLEFYEKSKKGIPGEVNFYSKKYNRGGLFEYEKTVVSKYFEG